ncbi:hypothetical protein PUN28_018327 [Cardiocondyla obscurior]|uniref:Uncharacterized protein n=1 Tax=Cardiocondyla obscurior TaxID=286306 RepID=A0AAW2EKM5_9HYME
MHRRSPSMCVTYSVSNRAVPLSGARVPRRLHEAAITRRGYHAYIVISIYFYFSEVFTVRSFFSLFFPLFHSSTFVLSSSVKNFIMCKVDRPARVLSRRI